MLLKKLWQGWFERPETRRSSNRPPRRTRVRLALNALEDRTVPADYSAATVPELIAAIDAANQTPEADTITLTAPTLTLTEVDNFSNGATGLPTIAAGEDLTILGNGGVIERSTASGTPVFRLFDVAFGASLTLQNVTLQGGYASEVGVSRGGAILNQGALILSDVTVQNNIAAGNSVVLPDFIIGEHAAGGGIYSSGSLTMDGSVIRNNQANGAFGTAGGSAFGGGLYVSSGTVTLSDVELVSNSALGGNGGTLRTRGKSSGGPGGNGFGGGMYVAGGVVTVHDSRATDNAAKGGAGGAGKPRGSPGKGIGGGLYIEADASVCLDGLTESNVKRNKASTSNPNIAGPYTRCS